VRARFLVTTFALVATGLVPRAARAGGFELPDNGTQALGRGATFVAKADDPTAIYYNPAGLARQRGTRLLLNGNAYLHSFSFQRTGFFPDDPDDAATPWGDRPFPLVRNTAGPSFAPFLALSTDFGTLDRLTVAAGVFGPSWAASRTFPLGVRNAPAASRYDFVQSRTSILLPTAAAAYRVTPWLDVGVSAHLVLGRFDHTFVSYTDVGQCPNVEYQPCDSRGTLAASSTNLASTIGALLRPSPSLAFGASFRTPVSVEAEGTMTSAPPELGGVEVAPGRAFLSTALPWVLRTGVRYIALDHDFEIYDLELDVTYEAWRSAQGRGPRLQIPRLGQLEDIDTNIVHGYKSTVSVRAGGAYNFQAAGGTVSLRAGGYFDSPATEHAFTRLDYDTLAKVAGTLGFGYGRGALQVDVGYAAVASIPRVVGTGAGAVAPINFAQGGQPVDGSGDALPAINEGAYRGFTHVFSLGATVTFDLLFGAKKPRAVRFGNPYEPGYVAPGEAPREEVPREEAPREEAPREEPPREEPRGEEHREEEREEVQEDEPEDEPAPPKPAPPPKPPEAKPAPRPAPAPVTPPAKKKSWWEELEDDD
jgi:long-subunit fatty acid transport protein